MAEKRVRMSGVARREQLIEVGRALFAKKGFDGTSMEEAAAQAGVSKPVVYEHFGGKEGLYAVIVDREVQSLVSAIQTSLESSTHPREILEAAALTLLDYIESNTDGFRVLVRDTPNDRTSSSFSSVLGDVAMRVEYLVAEQFERSNMEPGWAPLYCADACRFDRAGRAVVARRSLHAEGSCGSTRRQPGVVRAAQPQD